MPEVKVDKKMPAEGMCYAGCALGHQFLFGAAGVVLLFLFRLRILHGKRAVYANFVRATAVFIRLFAAS